MPKLRKVSGDTVVRILCNKMDFEISGQSGSHVRLSKMTPEGKIGTVVPLHNELKIGTLSGVLKLGLHPESRFAGMNTCAVAAHKG